MPRNTGIGRKHKSGTGTSSSQPAATQLSRHELAQERGPTHEAAAQAPLKSGPVWPSGASSPTTGPVDGRPGQPVVQARVGPGPLAHGAGSLTLAALSPPTPAPLPTTLARPAHPAWPAHPTLDRFARNDPPPPASAEPQTSPPPQVMSWLSRRRRAAPPPPMPRRPGTCHPVCARKKVGMFGRSYL